MSTTPSQYPQSDRLNMNALDRAAVAEFLEWCSQQGLHLAKHVPERNFPVLINETHEDLVMRFLGIDTSALEQERRAMLAQLTQTNNKE